MKILLSLDYNFVKEKPDLVVESILKYDKEKLIDGIIYEINTFDDYNVELAGKLAKLLKAYSLDFKIKGISLDNKFIHQKYALEQYNKIASLLEEKIQVIYSPALKSDTDNGFFNTFSMLKSIDLYIRDNEFNIDVSIKDVEYSSRISNLDFYKLLDNIPNLNVCFDIGDTFLQDKELNIEKSYIPKLNNIILYDNNTHSSKCPFIHGNIDLYDTFTYLKSIGYSKDIIIDIKDTYLDGEIVSDKIKSYIIEAKKVLFIKSQFFREVD